MRPEDRHLQAKLALQDLRSALTWAKRAGCAPELLTRIRAAIKSAEGAYRHAKTRATKDQA